ncbi:hypothetical protein, no similarity [Maudiozyma saulgeensis]|uniref:Uncharacterized protein n=1 Tax=Maudiozyma saulgeensis TaxID=1789683 RepID=A0A1X7R0S3_9SACH|nr:hypothetical protein, no similarity [Kazachstania saulgeensis]
MANSSPPFSNSAEIIGLAPTVPRQRQDKVSKYAKYDDILGSSKHLTMKKKKNRVETFEKSTIHSMVELINILIAKKNSNNLSFHIRATIPFSSFDLPFHPTPDAVDALYDKIRENIYDACGIALVLNHTDRAKDNVTRSKRYICRQDSRGDVSKNGRGSILKQYHCGSRFIFKYKDRYAFVELDLIHRVNHNVNIPVPTLTKAEFTKKDNITNNRNNETKVNELLPGKMSTAPVTAQFLPGTETNNIGPMIATPAMTGMSPVIGYQPAMTYPYPNVPIPIYYQNSTPTTATNMQTYNPQAPYYPNEHYLQPIYNSTNNGNPLPSVHANFQQQQQQPLLNQIPQYQKIRTPPQSAPATIVPYQLQQAPILPSVSNINGTAQYAPNTVVSMELAPTMAPTINQPRILPSFDEGFNKPAVLRGSLTNSPTCGLNSPQPASVESNQENIDKLKKTIEAFQTLKEKNEELGEDDVFWFKSYVNDMRESLLKLGNGDPDKIKCVLSETSFLKSIGDIESIMRELSGNPKTETNASTTDSNALVENDDKK